MTSLKSMIEESMTHKNFCPLFARVLGEMLEKKGKSFEPLYNYINLFFYSTGNGGIIKFNKETNTVDPLEKDVSNITGRDNKIVNYYLTNSKFKSRVFSLKALPRDKSMFKVTECRYVGDEKIEKGYINLMGSMKKFCYDEAPALDVLHSLNKDKKVKDGFKRMMAHIRKVWANNNENTMDYLKKWIACTINGVKTGTFLYLKSKEGTGKSMVVDFIQKHVLGHGVVKIVNDVDKMFEWNKTLIGTLLLNLDEPKTKNYKAFQNDLKIAVNRGNLHVNQKFKDPYEVERTFNVIITTNLNIIKIDDDNKRRCVYLDVNEEYIGNDDYFKNILNECYNDEVGRYFYNFFINYYEKTDKKEFESLEINKPHTENYKGALASHTPTHISFLKDEHLRKNNIIFHTKDSFYKNYEKYCKDAHKTPFHRVMFFTQLNSLKIFSIGRISRNGTRPYIIYTELSDLYDLLFDKEFIDEKHDDIDKEELLKLPMKDDKINFSYIDKTYKPKIEAIDDEPEEDEEDDNILKIQLENEKKEKKELKGENHKLKDEIRKLKELLSKSTKPQNTEEKEIISNDDDDDNDSINLADFCEEEDDETDEPDKIIECKKNKVIGNTKKKLITVEL